MTYFCTLELDYQINGQPAMKSATFSELRNNAKHYFDAIEKGESIEVYRHGKLIAVISPARQRDRDRWKNSKPVDLSGAALSAAILAERNE